MENLQTSYGTTSQWLRDDDPLYPCPTVAERHKLYCYLMVTSRILDVDGGDWAKTVAWCRKAEPDWVATCFQSLGRDASGRSLQDPEEILRICALAGDDGEPVRLRRSARHHEHGRRRAPLGGVLRTGAERVAQATASTGSARSSAASRGTPAPGAPACRERRAEAVLERAASSAPAPRAGAAPLPRRDRARGRRAQSPCLRRRRTTSRLPSLAMIVSPPSPPSSTSRPGPPVIVSRPLPPRSTSSPARPTRKSRNGVPLSLSSRAVPTNRQGLVIRG